MAWFETGNNRRAFLSPSQKGWMGPTSSVQAARSGLLRRRKASPWEATDILREMVRDNALGAQYLGPASTEAMKGQWAQVLPKPFVGSGVYDPRRPGMQPPVGPVVGATPEGEEQFGQPQPVLAPPPLTATEEASIKFYQDRYKQGIDAPVLAGPDGRPILPSDPNYDLTKDKMGNLKPGFTRWNEYAAGKVAPEPEAPRLNDYDDVSAQMETWTNPSPDMLSPDQKLEQARLKRVLPGNFAKAIKGRYVGSLAEYDAFWASQVNRMGKQAGLVVAELRDLYKKAMPQDVAAEWNAVHAQRKQNLVGREADKRLAEQYKGLGLEVQTAGPPDKPTLFVREPGQTTWEPEETYRARKQEEAVSKTRFTLTQEQERIKHSEERALKLREQEEDRQRKVEQTKAFLASDSEAGSRFMVGPDGSMIPRRIDPVERRRYRAELVAVEKLIKSSDQKGSLMLQTPKNLEDAYGPILTVEEATSLRDDLKATLDSSGDGAPGAKREGSEGTSLDPTQQTTPMSMEAIGRLKSTVSQFLEAGDSAKIRKLKAVAESAMKMARTDEERLAFDDVLGLIERGSTFRPL